MSSFINSLIPPWVSLPLTAAKVATNVAQSWNLSIGSPDFEVIPPSLGKTQYTKTPFYLYLYGADSYQLGSGFLNLNRGWRGWKSDEVIRKADRKFVLPLPERGFGARTELKITDEEKFLGYPDFFVGLAREIYGENWKNEFLSHGMGGSNIPLDFTAVTVYGTKKRKFQFTFDLFGLNSDDSKSIGNFCYEMHGLSTVRPAGYTMLWQGAPYVWTFRIWNDTEDVTNYWLPSPQACAMEEFYSTPTNYIQTLDNQTSSRAIVTMTFVEIEPVGYKPTTKEFRPAWQSPYNW